jgi:hypothetical protein
VDDGAPDVVLTIDATPAGWRIEARFGAQARTREVARAGRDRELQLEIAQKAVELVRDVELTIPTPTTTTTTTSTPASTAANVPSTRVASSAAQRSPSIALSQDASAAPAEAARLHRFGLEGTFGAQLLYRGVSDLLLAAGARLGIGGGLGLHLQTGLTPSSGVDISVLEWQLQAGIGYRFDFARILRFEPTLLGGLLVHHYSTSIEGGGTYATPLGCLALVLGARVSRHVAFELAAAPGLAGEEYTHVRSGDEIWSRSRYRLALGAGLILQ